MVNETELSRAKLQNRIDRAIRKIRKDELKKQGKRVKRSAEITEAHADSTKQNGNLKKLRTDDNANLMAVASGSAPKTSYKNLSKCMSNIPVSNGFGSLSDMEDDETNENDHEENEEDEQNDNFVEVTHKYKKKQNMKERALPPIVMCGVPHDQIKHTIDKVVEIAKEDVVHFRTAGKNLNIITYNIETFKAVREYVKECHYEHYSYTLREDRQLSMVVRGIHSSVKIDEISASLVSEGLVPIRVIPMTKRANINDPTRIPADLFQINFKSDTSLDDIRSISYVCRFRVTWEFKRKSAVTQCRRCQRFGHAASNCEMKYRCVKCDSQHQPGQCQKPKEDDPCCINCSEKHPANFSKCKVRSDYVSKLKARSIKTNPTEISRSVPTISPRQRLGQQTHKNLLSEPRPQELNINFVRDGVSFAQAVKPDASVQGNSTSTGKNQSPDNVFDFFDNEFQNIFQTDMITFMSSLNKFYPKYIELTSPDDKRKALLRFLCEVRGK